MVALHSRKQKSPSAQRGVGSLCPMKEKMGGTGSVDARTMLPPGDHESQGD